MWKSAKSISAQHLVDEVMRAHPATVRVFLDHRMGCVGCPIGSFHSIDDACREHGIDRERFLGALGEMLAVASTT